MLISLKLLSSTKYIEIMADNMKEWIQSCDPLKATGLKLLSFFESERVPTIQKDIKRYLKKSFYKFNRVMTLCL